MKKFTHNPWIISGVLILVGVFLMLSRIYYSDFSLTIISHQHPSESLKTTRSHELFKGEKITGTFIAQEDNLGIIVVRFDNLKRINEDIIRLRIKQKGDDAWYFQDSYSTKMMYSLPLYPFGFPEIKNSKGKTFAIEITSLQGRPGNAIALDAQYPSLISKYKSSKQSIAQNSHTLITFLSKKLVSSVKNFQLIEYTLIYFAPFLLYISRSVISRYILAPLLALFVFLRNHKITKKYPLLYRILNYSIPKQSIAKYSLIWIMLSLTIVDIFFIEAYSYVMMIFLILTWYISMKESRVSQLNYLSLGRILLFIAPLLFILSLSTQAEKTAAWACICLIIGTVSSLTQIRKNA